MVRRFIPAHALDKLWSQIHSFPSLCRYLFHCYPPKGSAFSLVSFLGSSIFVQLCYRTLFPSCFPLSSFSQNKTSIRALCTLWVLYTHDLGLRSDEVHLLLPLATSTSNTTNTTTTATTTTTTTTTNSTTTTTYYYFYCSIGDADHILHMMMKRKDNGATSSQERNHNRSISALWFLRQSRKWRFYSNFLCWFSNPLPCLAPRKRATYLSDMRVLFKTDEL